MLYIVGFLLVIIAVAMMVPMATDLVVGNDDWVAFALSALITLFLGGALALTCYQPQIELTLRQTFVLTTVSWMGVAAVSGLPFYFSEYRFNLADSYFEAMSGLTTTGATVIVGLDTAPPGLLLWRSLLQWLGGLGIVVMAIAILPFLRIGGMQLFHSESSDRSDKVVPRVSDLAISIGVLYLILTMMCFGLLRIAGMTSFDAINHAMTTVSTGGFSTKDASVGYWPQAGVQWTIVLFMIAGALPFVRYISFVKGDYDVFWRDSQVRRFLLFLLFCWLVVALWLTATSDVPFWGALRLAAFNVTSIMTTTGFATDNYSLWGPWAVGLFFLFTFIGGCTGSTTGGIKVFRFEILGLMLKNQLVRLYSPHQVQRREYNDKPFGTEVLISVASFFFVFFTFYLVFSVSLALTGLDFVTATSGAATALANVGPGLGEVIGMAGNFSTLPNNAKWLLALAMLLGRLEFFTVLVMMTPGFWKR
ncbi:MAG TPA: TrkH family potassium uptake protein [Alphaproteobacteria bacterium]|nr:TrkH family potassium uptake protein [Alphaproteobacteria bacterium]